jgi:uncharacterized membrane protein
MSKKKITFFDIKLYPNSSINKITLKYIFLFFILIIVFLSLFFYFIGAWPVSGFLGLDILLFYLAFKASYINSKTSERVLLRKKLMILKKYPNGIVKKFYLEPTWLKIIIKTKNNKTSLLLSSKGRAIPVGNFLNKEELISLAQELKNALIAREKNIFNL